MFLTRMLGLKLGTACPKHRGVAMGVQWVHLHPQGGEKIFSGVIYRKNV